MRAVGPGDEEDDPDCDGYASEEDGRYDDEPEGSFFGASDEAACNRVWGMFARAQVRRGHGAGLINADGHVMSSPKWRGAGAAA